MIALWTVFGLDFGSVRFGLGWTWEGFRIQRGK
jgi:hypothetical protein